MNAIEELDAKIAEYAGGNEAIAEKVKADILSKMQDSRAIDMPEMLDEMVAMSAREYEPEARRMKVHDLRGSGKTEGEKLSGIEELIGLAFNNVHITRQLIAFLDQIADFNIHFANLCC
jgi:hypothetical protein